MHNGQLFGRTGAEWADLEDAGWEFLIGRARQPYPVTTYTEMNAVLAHRTGQPPWNLDSQADQAQFRALGIRTVTSSLEKSCERIEPGFSVRAGKPRVRW